MKLLVVKDVLVGPRGFEPRTTGTRTPHSTKLNYGPNHKKLSKRGNIKNSRFRNTHYNKGKKVR